jgi:predicted nucleic acid-binding protein
MIVVDTNVIAHFYMESARTPVARRVFEKDPEWRVPPLWKHDFLNVLATASRQDPGRSGAFVNLWKQMAEHFVAQEADIQLSDALQWAIQSRITAYDAQFVTLAKALDVPLVSEDSQLQKTFPAFVMSMEAFLA